MSRIFVRQRIKQAETTYQPILPPNDPHPTRGRWINNGLDAYRAVFGEAEYEKNSRNDVPFPMPADTPAERRNLWWRMRKTQALFGFKAAVTGRRATHSFGVGARGTVTVVPRPAFPDHEFFTPGRVFPCRIRHANASYKDDASCQVRACSIKFADARHDSPFDLVMNTGVIQAFWSFDTFMRFAFARIKTNPQFWEPQKEWMRLLPGGLIGSVESLRLAPTSFAEMLYHSCIAYPVRSRDGRMRYAKYRLVPHGLEQESGLLPTDLQRECWVQTRRPGDDRPIQYLADEYRSRLARGPVEYALQVQLREFDPTRDTHEFFNSARVWDPRSFPWQALATVRLTEPLADFETERMRMWLGHQPPSLGLTDSYSAVDYGSLAWVRYHVYTISQANRWLLRTLGRQRQLSQDF
jgi:arachidonate 5-lipoxygenase